MSRIPIILDCDTGVDDAIAILAALKLPQLDLRAITAVAGNVELDKTAVNTGRVLDIAGAEIPVYRGAAGPIFGKPVTATYVHGNNGLNDLDLPAPRHAALETPAWDAIYAEAKRQNGALEIVAIGPLTNLGLAFLKYRELPGLIRRIVIMGGAASGGNVTPAAEFNIYADPEAADIVFNAGVPVYMCGLDVTMKSYFLPEEVEHLAALGSEQGRFARDVLQGILAYSQRLGLPGVCMHDPCAVLYAADDSLFTTEHVGIRVETRGKLTRGKTVTDLYSDKQMEHNAYIVTDVDREAFRDRLTALIAAY